MTLIPPHYLNTLVAIGEGTEGGFRCGATGFLYGHPGDISDDRQQMYYYYLVTNRHVVDRSFSQRAIEKPVARFNLSTGKASQLYPIEHWTWHPNNLDVAVAPLSPPFFVNLGIDYGLFTGDNDVLSRQEVERADIREGNGVFVLGFPLELAGQERNYVIVRQGIFARIQDWLRGDEDTFFD